MAMAVCWNCGARAVGPTCQMCGAAQQPGAAPGQPVVNQASMSVRPPQPPASNPYAANGQYPYPPANQAGGWQQAQPSQPQAPQAGWQSYQLQPGAAQPGYQQPSAYQQQQAAMGMRSGFSPAGGAASLVTVLPMALVGGVIAAVVGALVWAYIGHYTNTVFGFLLGVLVGLGVWLGARGYRHIALAGLAAVLGLFSLLLGIYFLVSLDYSSAIDAGSANLFALPVALFFSHLGDFFSAEPYFYLYLIVVPLLAGATTYRRGRRRW